MALDQAANFVRETVTSAISAGDTTINVADASPFPVPPEGYNIVVWDGAAYVRPDQDPDVEIMRVTDTDTTNDTLTVARGQEGTSDVSHPDTSVVVVAQTAKMIADIASEKISNPVTETVDANNNDVTNVGALDVDKLSINQMSEVYVLSSSQTIPSGSLTTVEFDDVEDGSESPLYTMSNGELTVQEAGYYGLSILLGETSLSAGDSQDVEIVLNGNREFLQFDEAGDTFIQSVKTTYISNNISANSNLKINYRQDSGGDSEIGGSSTDTRLAVWRLG